MTKLLTEQEPSGQTVREILQAVYKSGVLAGFGADMKDSAEHLTHEAFKTDHNSGGQHIAAINAHIVSLLEEMKKECRLHYFEDVIDAAIAEYKEGGNHDR